MNQDGIQKELSDVITRLNENIEELQSQIALLQSINFSKPVDENTWHELCETPLRSSSLLAALVQNIFPLAENVVVHCNYVYFNIMGFKVQIPTSRRRSINVDTSWYKKDNGEPKLEYSTTIQCLMGYFDAVDNKKGWYECAKNRLRYPETCKKWFLFIVWFFYYKWKKSRSQAL